MNFSEEELLEIVAMRVRKYTSNESTSVMYETARRIMASVLYCMEEDTIEGTKEQENGFEMVRLQKTKKAREAFLEGLTKKKEKIEQAKKRYELLMNSFEDYCNTCYKDTIVDGMRSFFEYYDVEFDATNHLLTLDYPLMFEIRDLKGIDLIDKYLEHTVLEQRFLAVFDKEKIIRILLAYHEDYEELIINIAKIVLRNVLGKIIAKQPITTLSISEEERLKIRELCERKNEKQIERIVQNALEELIEEKLLSSFELFEYLKNEVQSIAYEIVHGIKQNCLEQVFVEEKQKKVKEKEIYIDGTKIEDEELRKLIEKISKVEFDEKLVLIKNKVKSLADLKEIIQECFYEEEREVVFSLLSQQERNYLLGEIEEKIEFGELLTDWEESLVEYQKHLLYIERKN